MSMCAPSAGPHGKCAVINKVNKLGAQKKTQTEKSEEKNLKENSRHVAECSIYKPPTLR